LQSRRNCIIFFKGFVEEPAVSLLAAELSRQMGCLRGKGKFSDKVVSRFSLYLRYLEQVEGEGVYLVTSSQIAQALHLTAAQVRRDLSCLGQLGLAGVGYSVKKLVSSLEKILGLNKKWPMALVGAGNLGAALFSYSGFRRRGFEIIAIFDKDPDKIGTRWANVAILDITRLPETVKQKGIKIGVIAVPHYAAQEVADRLVSSGVKAILNFSPCKIRVPESVKLQDVDVSTELETLSWFLVQ